MILSDDEIKEYVRRGDLKIGHYDEKFVQPASYDLHLSPWFRAFKGGSSLIEPTISTMQTALWNKKTLIITSGEFLLASTMESVEIPEFLCGRLEGKSSLGRLGLTVHVTAGFFDPGFRGYPTLEIVNLNRRPIVLRAGMPIAQMSFSRMSMVPRNSYGQVAGSKYQDQEEAPVESQFWKNYPDKFLESQ